MKRCFVAMFLCLTVFTILRLPAYAQTQTDAREGLGGSVAIKPSCDVATTANITLSATQTVDGIALSAGDRVCVKDQTDGTENGIYTVQSGAWTRTKDWNGTRDITAGTFVFSVQGTSNAATLWYVSNTTDPTIDTDSVTFSTIGSITTTAFTATILDDATAAAVLTTLGIAEQADSVWETGTGTTGSIVAPDAIFAAIDARLDDDGLTHSGTHTFAGDINLTGSDIDITGDVDFTGDADFSGGTVTFPAVTSFTSLEIGTPDGSPSTGEINVENVLVDGTAMVQAVTPAAQAFNDDSTLTFTIGCTITTFNAFLINATADHGYSTGDKAKIYTDNDSERGCTPNIAGTDIEVHCGTTAQVISPSTLNLEDITEGNWNVGVTALCINVP